MCFKQHNCLIHLNFLYVSKLIFIITSMPHFIKKSKISKIRHVSTHVTFVSASTIFLRLSEVDWVLIYFLLSVLLLGFFINLCFSKLTSMREKAKAKANNTNQGKAMIGQRLSGVQNRRMSKHVKVSFVIYNINLSLDLYKINI